MVKAIFIDYTGTMVREDDPYTMKLLSIFLKHSDLKDPKITLEKVWGLIKKFEYEHYLDTFMKKDEMVDYILDYSVKNFNLDYNLDELHEIWKTSWVKAPLFDDVEPFFRRCQLPIYIITNDDYAYVQQSLSEKGLQAAAIISAETVKACKPHQEILEEGLRVANIKKEEVIFIGDSYRSDVKCARMVGIECILVDRKKQMKYQDVRIIRSLDELEV